jgi:hypothetical protein
MNEKLGNTIFVVLSKLKNYKFDYQYYKNKLTTRKKSKYPICGIEKIKYIGFDRQR